MQLHERIARNLALTVTGIGLVVTASRANAQTWETLLDLQDTNNADAQGWTLLVDPYSGQLAPSRLFFGGMIARHAAVLVFDQSTGTYDRHDVPDGFRVNQLGVDPSSGNLFSAMLSYAIPGWQVSSSTDGGTNWTVADLFALSTNGSGDAWGFAADDAGNLFVTGSAGQDSNGLNGHWVVRKSTDHGQSWSTVDNYPNAVPNKIHFLSGTNGGLFVVGYRNGGSTWTVRRSRDSGASWAVVDSLPGIAYGVSSDSAGNVYVVGESGGWTVRQSSNGGNTWQTIYSGDPTGFGASDIAADNSGNLWVTGSYDFAWAVLHRDPVGSWQPVEFLAPAGSSTSPILSSGEAITVDRAGNVFVTGYIRDDVTLPFRWVVFQRLSDTPVLRTAVSGQNLVLSWPASYQGFMLQSATTLVNGGDWQDSNLTPTVIGDQNVVNVSATNATGFFRLRN